MRSKEDAQDYRYFPDPDLLPVVVDDKLLQEISNKLPELPKAKKKRFIEEYKIPKYNAEVITSDIDIANYFETVAKVCEDPISASNWVMVEVLKVLNQKNISILDFSIAPAMLGKLIQKINNKTISSKIAKEIFAEMLVDPKDPDILIKEKGLTQITSTEELKKVVDEILQEFPEQVKQYRQGSQKVIGFLIGALMKKTNGKANPQIGKELLEEMIKNSNL
jgi:aspartyl-tRNA(Asn)/glutamyl-tRNA(Gln) amidotransferase subunit B